MEDAGSSASIILFLILLFLDMMFYAFGAAISNANRREIEQKAEESQDSKSICLLKLLDSPEKYVNTVQLVATLTNLIMGGFFLGVWRERIDLSFQKKIAMSETFLDYVPTQVLHIATILITGFLLLFILLSIGVLLPKKIAQKKPDQIAYFLIGFVNIFVWILTPVTFLVSATVKGILKLFQLDKLENAQDVTEEEIIDMVNEGHEQGVLEANEAEMIHNIFEFGDKEAKDIMTHAHAINAIEINTTLSEAIHYMLDGNYSRYPVYEENLDHIVGILYLKDAMKLQVEESNGERFIGDIRDLIREAIYIPETSNIDTVFDTMQKKKVQLMIVVDEYGQTSGLVSMEDILEEIVGNIQDEYDEEEEHIQLKGVNEYIIEGMTPLEELKEKFNFDFSGEDFETLNGFLISRLDHIPEEDEEYEMDFQGYHLKVLSCGNRMIQSVLFTKLPDLADEALEEELPFPPATVQS